MKPFYKTFLLLIINSPFFTSTSFSQSPLVKQWDYRFGGSDDEEFTCLIQTNDGGYIIGGTSMSPVSGDKSQPNWGLGDFWIVKTDSMGIKQWDKRYGGTGLEQLFSIKQTKDGGYILAGTTGSGISGDKSSPNYGYYDYWLLKIDSLGVKQWDNDFGGTDEEALSEVQQTADGGYILGGFSISGIGGTKTQANWDPNGNTFDYWVVKTDSLGNQQWDKSFGGNNDDLCYSLQQTPDGGYIIGGTSRSGLSGNKTQPSHGFRDYWLVKIDSAGSILWQKVLGGSCEQYFSSIMLTPDGGFLVGGNSCSQVSLDKSQATCGSSYDYWIVKTDSLGNKQWDKDFGGSDLESADYKGGNFFLTTDGGYIYSATSFSPVSCDKTEPNLGDSQNWTIKMDSSGNMQWDKTARLPDDFSYYSCAHAIQTNDGCYILANPCTVSAGGDKTQTGWGDYDYWFAKYCDTTLISSTMYQVRSTEYQLFPNPSSGIFQITFPSSSNQKTNYTIEVVSTLGQTVFAKQLQTLNFKLQTNLDVSFLPKGIYVLKLNDGVSLLSKLFIIQ